MTPLEKLKALAAAKKAGQLSATQLAETEKETKNETTTVESVVSPTIESKSEPVLEQVKETRCDEDKYPSIEEPAILQDLSGGDSSGLDSDHPLKMQLAELEQALTEKLPEFRTILRDIHSKLRQDPDVVTAMSEEEIGILVDGLIHHANVEVITPGKVKAAKKAAKVPVSASDL